jgi:hypothetical protein
VGFAPTEDLTPCHGAHVWCPRNPVPGTRISVGRDLFDDWTVSIWYGRTGQGGQMKRFASPQAKVVRAIIRERLRRRLSAPKRIGCPYQLTSLESASGFDASAWLPGEVMARFFA